MASPRRRVAQLVELWSPKPVVVGSSPAAPATSRDRSDRPRPGRDARLGRDARRVAPRPEARESRPGPGRRLRRFLDEAWSELKKVTWPTREQTRNLTVLVFVISALMGVYITIFDLGFTALVAFVTELGQ